jgi:hypothetical protein
MLHWISLHLKCQHDILKRLDSSVTTNHLETGGRGSLIVIWKAPNPDRRCVEERFHLLGRPSSVVSFSRFKSTSTMIKSSSSGSNNVKFLVRISPTPPSTNTLHTTAGMNKVKYRIDCKNKMKRCQIIQCFVIKYQIDLKSSKFQCFHIKYSKIVSACQLRYK